MVLALLAPLSHLLDLSRFLLASLAAVGSLQPNAASKTPAVILTFTGLNDSVINVCLNHSTLPGTCNTPCPVHERVFLALLDLELENSFIMWQKSFCL